MMFRSGWKQEYRKRFQSLTQKVYLSVVRGPYVNRNLDGAKYKLPLLSLKKTAMGPGSKKYYADEDQQKFKTPKTTVGRTPPLVEEETPHYKLKTKLRGFSPQANYTDRVTGVCWRS
jgi:hypothetical protein